MNTAPDKRKHKPKHRNRSSWIYYLCVSLLITGLVVLLASCDLSGGDDGGDPFASTDTTPTPSPTVSTPTPTPHVQHTVVLQFIHMFDAKSGWALTKDNHLLRTTSGAAQWQDVTPAISWSQYQLTAPDFLDSQHAWIGVQTKSAFSIFSTNDGGNIWVESPLPESTNGIGIAQIDFINADEGWLLFNKFSSPKQAVTDLLATQDDGSSWLDIASTDAPQGALSSLPTSGSTQMGIYFLDENVGWVTGTNPVSGRFEFSTTQDGGANWQTPNLSLPSATLKDTRVLTFPPIFFDNAHALMPVLFLAGDSTQLSLYTTSNSGQRWSSTSPITVASSVKDASTLSFIDTDPSKDAATGWVVGPNNTLSHTADGGQHWSELPTHLPTSVTAITQLEFVSSTMGWAIGSQGNTQTLLQSVDGGNTWTAVSTSAK
jgi:photosystem II stability/assembly factor-like uncharacterized protein